MCVNDKFLRASDSRHCFSRGMFMKRKRNIKEFFRIWLKPTRFFSSLYARIRRFVPLYKNHDKKALTQRSVTNIIYVTHGADNMMIATESIAYLERVDRVTMAYSFTGEQYITDKSIDKLVSELDKRGFFRIHRACIINRDLVQGYKQASSNRLLLITSFTDTAFFVSQRNAVAFKRWWEKK